MEKIKYDRVVLSAVLMIHQKRPVLGCKCGWHNPEGSHVGHIIEVYEDLIDLMVRHGFL